MANNGFAALAHVISRYGMLTFPPEVEMYHMDAHGTATRITQNIAAAAPTHQVVIRQRPGLVEIWTTRPITRMFRIVVVNYRVRPYDRSVIGYIRFELGMGTFRVSDYVMSLSTGVLPTIFQEDTVYIIGIRYEAQFNIEISLTDSENIVYLEQVVVTPTRMYAVNHRLNMRGSSTAYHRGLNARHPAFLPQTPLRAIVPLSAATPALVANQEDDGGNIIAIQNQAANLEMDPNDEHEEIGNVSVASSVPHRCTICCERTADHRFNPCSHAVCMACAQRIIQEDSTFNRCPFCRTFINSVTYDPAI